MCMLINAVYCKVMHRKPKVQQRSIGGAPFPSVIQAGRAFCLPLPAGGLAAAAGAGAAGLEASALGAGLVASALVALEPGAAAAAVSALQQKRPDSELQSMSGKHASVCNESDVITDPRLHHGR